MTRDYETVEGGIRYAYLHTIDGKVTRVALEFVGAPYDRSNDYGPPGHEQIPVPQPEPKTDYESDGERR